MLDKNVELKVGDKIDIGGFVTTLDEILYDPYIDDYLYWFHNQEGEYKFNVRCGIIKVCDN